jgi:hypothetical protein
MNARILEQIWKLRTDPFYPEVDAKGVPIKKEAIERSLNPLADDRVLPYYFDLYDWTSSNLVRELSSQLALAVFPTARTLPRSAALMVLISGSMETGLDSFANLVLHKIKLTTGHPPLVVDLSLDSRDKARNVASVAKRIITKLKFDKSLPAEAGEIVKQMQEEYDRTRKEEEGRKDATYSDLFLSFRELLKPIGREIVLEITGGGDNDSWVHIYNSVKSCCSYVIVMTSDYAYAKTCYDAMISLLLNVAWIQLAPLNQEKARKYLASRLAAERIGGPAPVADELFPFTANAIQALYEPTEGGAAAGPLTYPIGWLRRMLYQALTDQLEALGKKHASAPPEELAAIDPQTTRIGSAEMKKTWEKNNR